ncbi:toxin-antitoxin system protein [Bifidobacterium sp. ESL0728]|uniref:toxin-antitoxin system protein n=1 Tax=Bifidobacterium sp. ESL0728 TaxID=2983220 RepID=UPI0023F71101|nr:toxin-antitoxin system protein [Bifidobacterium sp. ESL0728]WEV58400.1 toxin-antitoxin system protein [Bifidobacterium sp. ESL0728]
MATFEEYKGYLAHPQNDLENAPLADGSGEDAKQFGAALADPNTDKQELVKTVMGRPTLEEQLRGRKQSVQIHLSFPATMKEYAKEATKREKLSNMSEYLRSLVEKDAEAHDVKLSAL